MARNGNRNNTRSVRLDFGSNRLVIERNGTDSKDTQPFCAKSKSQTFLQDLCTAAGVKDDEIFKGSVNHMVFVTEAQAASMLGHSITKIPAFVDRDDDDDDDAQQSGPRHDHKITLAGDPGITNAGGGAPPDDDDLDDVDGDDDDDDDGLTDGLPL